MQGKIIKGIAGFYYVHIAGKGVYECKAKGIFRKNKIKPLVGDDVVIDILDEEKREGNIRDILARKNALIRPAVTNVVRRWSFCNQQAGSESESSGSFPDLNGASECTGRCLF